MTIKYKFPQVKTLATGSTLFIFFVLMQLSTWLPLRYWRIWGGGNFIDSQQILQWSKCYKEMGNLVFSSQGDCSGYIYGRTLIRILSFLHLNPTHTQIFGYAFMLILAFTISFQLNTFQLFRANPLLFIVVLSPPVLLLAERGNFDTLVLALVVSAGLLFTKDHQLLSLIPLALATLIKFYTFPLFLILFLLNNSKSRKLATAAVALLVLAQVFVDLQLIQTSFPTGFSWKFGASIWPRYLTQLNFSDPGELIDSIIGFIVFLIIATVLIYLSKRLNVSVSSTAVGSFPSRIIFYLLFGTHLSCYFFGMSFDYRLVFFAISGIIYLRSFVEKEDLLSKIVFIGLVIALWLTYPSYGLEPIGDLALECVTFIFGVRFLQLLKLDLGQPYEK
jgi:hypothetical protein